VKSLLRLSCSLALLAASAFAQDEVLNTPATQFQMSKLYRRALPSYVGFADVEHSFTVNAGGLPNEIHSSHQFKHNSVAMALGQDAAIVHTHPASVLPTPSPDDVNIAVRFGIPNYVLSRYALWVAFPDGTTRKVADVQWDHGKAVLSTAVSKLKRQAAHLIPRH